MKAFWHVYKNSLHNIDYYKDLLSVNMGFSFKYFFMLALMVSIIATASITIPWIPKLQQSMHEAFDKVIEAYPDELVITSEGGNWSINQEEPYIIATPEVAEMTEAENGYFPNNLVVFDHEGTINDLNKLDALMVINEVNLIIINGQGKIEAYPLEGIPDGEVNKDLIKNTVNNARGIIKYIPIIVIFFTLIGTYFYFSIIRLFILLFTAFILWLFGVIRGAKGDFGSYYRFAIHAMTLPLTVELLLVITGAGAGTGTYQMLIILGLNLVFGVVVVERLLKSGAIKKI